VKTTQEKIAVMQAYVDGKKIEWLSNGEWAGIEVPAWNWISYDYRVKQDPPREVFVILNSSGHVDYSCTNVRDVPPRYRGFRPILMREVMDE